MRRTFAPKLLLSRAPNLDWLSRRSWKQVILKVNETHGGEHASGPFPPSLAKIEYAALLPSLSLR